MTEKKCLACLAGILGVVGDSGNRDSLLESIPILFWEVAEGLLEYDRVVEFEEWCQKIYPDSHWMGSYAVSLILKADEDISYYAHQVENLHPELVGNADALLERVALRLKEIFPLYEQRDKTSPQLRIGGKASVPPAKNGAGGAARQTPPPVCFDEELKFFYTGMKWERRTGSTPEPRPGVDYWWDDHARKQELLTSERVRRGETGETAVSNEPVGFDKDFRKYYKDGTWKRVPESGPKPRPDVDYWWDEASRKWALYTTTATEKVAGREAEATNEPTYFDKSFRNHLVDGVWKAVSESVPKPRTGKDFWWDVEVGDWVLKVPPVSSTIKNTDVQVNGITAPRKITLMELAEMLPICGIDFNSASSDLPAVLRGKYEQAAGRVSGKAVSLGNGIELASMGNDQFVLRIPDRLPITQDPGDVWERAKSGRHRMKFWVIGNSLQLQLQSTAQKIDLVVFYDRCWGNGTAKINSNPLVKQITLTDSTAKCQHIERDIVLGAWRKFLPADKNGKSAYEILFVAPPGH